MRPLELALTLLVSIALVSLLLPSARRNFPALPLLTSVASLGLAVAQAVTEGYRWQMVPIYVVTAVLTFVVFRRHGAQGMPPSRGRRIARWSAATLGVLGLALGAAASAFFPVFQMPALNGRYAIGTTWLALRDSSRREPFVTDAAKRRELLVRVWYPATPAPDATPVRYGARLATTKPSRAMQGFARSVKAPASTFDYLAQIPTHAYADAPVAGSGTRYPVVLFSHGYGMGTEAQNTVQMEALASHGYIVLSIGHPYEAGGLEFPDGHVVTADTAGIGALMAVAPKLVPMMERERTEADPIRQDSLRKAAMALTPMFTTSLAIWVADTKFVLDLLPRLDTTMTLLAGRMNTSRVGIFGMSFGGATAEEICEVDTRCAAGINLDGLSFGDDLAHPLAKPFMIAYSEANAGMNDMALATARDTVYRVMVRGTTHLNWTDIPMMMPLLHKPPMLGTIDANRMETIMNAYVVAFFDAHLRGVMTPLMLGPSADFPDVKFERKVPGAVTAAR